MWFIDPQILGEHQSILQQKAGLKDKTSMELTSMWKEGNQKTFGKSLVCPLHTPGQDFGTTAQDTDPETTSLGFSASGSEWEWQGSQYECVHFVLEVQSSS